MSFNVPRLVLFSVLAVLSLSVSAADTPAVRRAREQFRWFKPEAARLALADLKQNPKYDYAKWSKAVEDVIAHQKDIDHWLDSNDPAENVKAVPYMKAYRDAMLANPALDCDRIVCTRYDLRMRVRALATIRLSGSCPLTRTTTCGFRGMNARLMPASV